MLGHKSEFSLCLLHRAGSMRRWHCFWALCGSVLACSAETNSVLAPPASNAIESLCLLSCTAAPHCTLTAAPSICLSGGSRPCAPAPLCDVTEQHAATPGGLPLKRHQVRTAEFPDPDPECWRHGVLHSHAPSVFRSTKYGRYPTTKKRWLSCGPALKRWSTTEPTCFGSNLIVERVQIDCKHRSRE